MGYKISVNGVEKNFPTHPTVALYYPDFATVIDKGWFYGGHYTATTQFTVENPAGSGKDLYITSLVISNTGSNPSTWEVIQDTTAGASISQELWNSKAHGDTTQPTSNIFESTDDSGGTLQYDSVIPGSNQVKSGYSSTSIIKVLEGHAVTYEISGTAPAYNILLNAVEIAR